MTETSSRSDPARCGNCGVAVVAADVTCPSCGVLLAAYQAPVGSLAGDAAIGDVGPSASVDTAPPIPVGNSVAATGASLPPAPSAPPPLQHTPASQSPIDDAMRRAHGEDIEAVTLETSATIADELAQMARSDSALAQEVEAELAGAKVAFDGASPTIVSGPAITPPAPEPPPVSRSVAADPPVEIPGAAIEVPVSPPTSRVPVRPRVSEPPVRPGQPPQVGPQSNRPIQWVSIVVIAVLFLVVVRAASSFGGLVTLMFGVFVVIGLLRVAGGAGRKTTWMPWDKSGDKNRWK